ncbi:MAG: AraC family transcriptional regulator [Kiritimatiellia bacterium]|nr:AraC family transcriptional regulator [Kiritimatiellia bacterium]
MTRSKQQALFLRRIAVEQGVAQLFALLPDISVFMKDRQGRFMFLNPRGCEYCGVKDMADALGKTDHDFFPKAKAGRYQADDRRVMTDGTPVLNRVEPEPGKRGTPRLVVTSKVPLRDASGKVIGVIGLSREVADTASASVGVGRVARAVEFFYARYGEKLMMTQVARYVGVSVNQLERLFRRTVGESPQRCLLQVRIEQACHKLRDSRSSMAEVAQACGFYDQAHFCHAFAVEIGCPPFAYRRRHQTV